MLNRETDNFQVQLLLILLAAAFKNGFNESMANFWCDSHSEFFVGIWWLHKMQFNIISVIVQTLCPIGKAIHWKLKQSLVIKHVAFYLGQTSSIPRGSKVQRSWGLKKRNRMWSCGKDKSNVNSIWSDKVSFLVFLAGWY